MKNGQQEHLALGLGDEHFGRIVWAVQETASSQHTSFHFESDEGCLLGSSF